MLCCLPGDVMILAGSRIGFLSVFFIVLLLTSRLLMNTVVFAVYFFVLVGCYPFTVLKFSDKTSGVDIAYFIHDILQRAVRLYQQVLGQTQSEIPDIIREIMLDAVSEKTAPVMNC
jgi:hypothetical protein